MKTIIGILLVGLLGFLGCSGSDDDTNTIGEATPVAPFGIIETPTPTYEWTPVPWATKYRLMVQDTNQESTNQDTSETAVIDEWYTAEEAGCASEESLCMVTPNIEVTGENIFKVQACANQECGLWSELLNFHFTALTAPRFTDNGDGTVTDNNTKLIWSKNADLFGMLSWPAAVADCMEFSFAGHSDWRLPSISELKSLIDTNQLNPALPPGNPFMNVQSYYYWSSTAYVRNPIYAWGVYMSNGDVFSGSKGLSCYVWPVRSGS